MFYGVNFLPVLISALASFVLGGLWYSPLLFGVKWATLMGQNTPTAQDMKRRAMVKLYAINFCMVFVSAFVLSSLVANSFTLTLGQVLKLGVCVWAGFTLPILVDGILWEKKGFTLFCINAGYRLASVLLMSLILGIW